MRKEGIEGACSKWTISGMNGATGGDHMEGGWEGGTQTRREQKEGSGLEG